MGGIPPLGHDARDKKLVVNPIEAEIVRSLFRLYLELGTVKKLIEEAGRLKLVSKRRTRLGGRKTGGLPFTRGHLYHLLNNSIYVGDVTHKGSVYPGQHDGIIDRKIFYTVRCQLDRNAAERRGSTNSRAPSLLTGLIYDDRGDRLCPTHTKKKGRRYRYYISKHLMRGTGAADAGWRLSAKELDGAVIQAVGDFLKDELRIIEALHLIGTAPGRLRGILHRAAALAEELAKKQTERPMLHRFLHRVTLHTDSMHIEIQRLGLDTMLTGNSIPDITHSELIDVTVPFTRRHRGVEARLIFRAAQGNAAAPDKNLIALIAQARGWFDQLVAGETASIQEIARCDGIDASDIGRNLQLAFLAPDIVEAILTGRQPIEFTAGRLRRIGKLPLEWDRQRRLLGFPA